MAAVPPAMDPQAREQMAQQLKQSLSEDPGDFSRWTEYVEFCEKGEDKNKLREAYEGFLNEFPLLYMYWKKFAEMEDSLGHEEEAKKIYDRGVKAVPSIELWTAYTGYVAEKSSNLNEIRSLFEKAVDAVGDDFNSSALWTEYISFETSQEEMLNVASIYRRVLTVPLKDLDKFWEKFKALMAQRPSQEFVDYHRGEDKVMEQDIIARRVDPKDVESERKKILLAWREQTYKNTTKEADKRKQFEGAIKRTYFHIFPLDETQLTTWRQYLDFEEREGDARKTAKLYERCLVPCSLYIEFWKKYALFYERRKQVEQARSVLHRAAAIHLKRKPSSHIALAEFEEQQGNLKRCVEIYSELLNGKGRTHLESILHAIHFYRRQNNVDACVDLFSKMRAHLDKSSQAYFDIQHAYFTRKTVKATEKARQLYKQATETHPTSKLVWLAYIEFENCQKETSTSITNETINALFESALSQEEMDTDDKLFIMKRYHEHLLHFADVAKMRELENRITTLEYSPKQSSNKRKADGADDRSAKVARTATTPAASTAAATQQQQQAAAAYNPQWAAYYQQQAAAQQQQQQQPNAAYNYQQQYAQYYAQQAAAQQPNASANPAPQAGAQQQAYQGWQ